MNHKDINSFNFLVADDGRVFMINFGITSMIRQEGQGDQDVLLEVIEDVTMQVWMD